MNKLVFKPRSDFEFSVALTLASVSKSDLTMSSLLHFLIAVTSAFKKSSFLVLIILQFLHNMIKKICPQGQINPKGIV